MWQIPAADKTEPNKINGELGMKLENCEIISFLE